MHIHHDHVGGHSHDHDHAHTHEHSHDGHVHSHEDVHAHSHDHEHPHTHDHLHEEGHAHHHHHHDHECGGNCGGGCSCAGSCEHTPMEELVALMKYMVGHNASHAKELAELAGKLNEIGNRTAYEQVMAAVSDFEKGNMRLAVILSSLEV